MPHPRVVHCKTTSYDVYVGRPSLFGNPFPLKHEQERVSVLMQYEAWLLGQPDLVKAVKRQLKGKTLGCFCAPRLCHGDILARLANDEPQLDLESLPREAEPYGVPDDDFFT